MNKLKTEKEKILEDEDYISLIIARKQKGR